MSIFKRKAPSLIAVHDPKYAHYTIQRFVACQYSITTLLRVLAKLGLESAQLDLMEVDNGFMKFGDVYIDDYVERVNTK